MNLVKVKLLLLSRTGRTISSNVSVPVIDKDFREVKGSKVYGSEQGRNIPIETEAQIEYFKTEQRSITKTGEAPQSSGYLVFRTKTFDSLIDMPRRGDLIVEIAGRQVEYKIIEIRLQGHLNNVANLIFVYFGDVQAEAG